MPEQFRSARTAATAILAVSVFVPAYLWITPVAAILEDPVWRWTLMIILVHSSLLATYPLEDVWITLRCYSAKQGRIRRLKSLTSSEKKVLWTYLQYERFALRWNPVSETVDVLALDRILYPAASSLGPDVYAIDEDVWKHLSAHPGLVKLDPLLLTDGARPRRRRKARAMRRKALAVNAMANRSSNVA